MSYLMNNQQKLNEIIFAQRNKNYGAYVLRSSYGSTVFKSLSFMALGFGTFISMAYYFSNHNGEPVTSKEGQVPIIDSVFVIPFNNEEKQPEPEMAEKPKPKPSPAQATEENNNIKVVDTTLNSSPKQVLNEELKPVSASTLTLAGNELRGPETNSGGSNGGKKGGMPDSSIVKGTHEVDSMPEFEGGLSALYRFLNANLRYPPVAIGEGVEGTVFVKFIVDEYGRVTKPAALNNLGYGLDEEAIRVVSIIPKFKKPAKADGRAVKTYFQLPIRYKIR